MVHPASDIPVLPHSFEYGIKADGMKAFRISESHHRQRKKPLMKIIEGLHAFLWDSPTVNNCNTYLIEGPPMVLVDPGHVRLFPHVSRGMEQSGLDRDDLAMILCTHAHPDHMEALQLFTRKPPLVAYHAAEWQMVLQYIKAFGIARERVEPDIFLTEGELTLGGHRFEVYHTPGHTPGGICLYWPSAKTLFTGDLVFKDGFGRTDLPGGDWQQLKQSLEKVRKLDVERVLPGHGGIVSGAAEVAANFRRLFDYID